MGTRARASGKCHAAETPRASYRWIYRRVRYRQQQADAPLPQSEAPQANREIPPALVEKPPQAIACADELVGIVWPIRDVATGVQCVPQKQVGHSRHTKSLP